MLRNNLLKPYESQEFKTHNICTSCASDLSCLTNDLKEIAIKNKEAGLVLATAIAASIIIYIVSKGIAEIIMAWHNVTTTKY